MSITVSIIVPIYNTYPYLEKCLKSIQEQTYHNFECVLIDDGSTDNSGMLCDFYCKVDKRFHVIHQINRGISSARNLGLEMSCGKYILFVDSDDEIKKDYLETLITNIEDFDCCVSGNSIRLNGTILDRCPRNNVFFNNDMIKKAYFENGLRKWMHGPVGILYKADIAKTVLFDDGLVVGEDIVYNLDYLKNTNKLKVIDYSGYIIRPNYESTTSRIANFYTELYEHDYIIIKEGIQAAKRRWGIKEKQLQQERIDSAPERYYMEMTNLFREGSPYNGKQIVDKIRHIVNDKEFIELIRKKEWGSCLRSEKMVKFCSYIKNPYLLAII